LLGFTWLGIRSKSFGRTGDITIEVVLNCELILKEIIKANLSTFLLKKTVENITILTCARATIHSASLYLWLCVLLAEALLALSMSWVTKLKLLASDSTINLFGSKAIIFHLHEVNNVSFVWALLDTEVDGTLANAFFVFVSASFNWWCWLIAGISRAEARFVVAVGGITIKRVNVAKQVTV